MQLTNWAALRVRYDGSVVAVVVEFTVRIVIGVRQSRACSKSRAALLVGAVEDLRLLQANP